MNNTTPLTNGGPAFPETGSRGRAVGGEGMSLREYYAAKAMAVLLAHDLERPIERQKGSIWVAYKAFAIAEAMIKESCEEDQQ